MKMIVYNVHGVITLFQLTYLFKLSVEQNDMILLLKSSWLEEAMNDIINLDSGGC